ncbi:MAG: hypothetical protein FWE94_03795 [Coriobacteriia bacterium]|nr:hypothetical protein [Coriobacteriia bacterium]
MKAVLALSEAVLADAVRKKVVWVVLVFATLLAFTVPSLPAYGGEVVSAVYRDVVLALMFAMSLVVGLALAVTRIPGEVERRTVFPVLARDVRRWQYVCATWGGMFIVVGLVVLAFTAIAIAVGALAYHEVMSVLLKGAFAAWLEAGVVVAVALLFSTRFSPVTSTVGALAFVFIGHSIPGLFTTLVGSGEHAAAPWWLPSLGVFDIIAPVAHGSGVSAVHLMGMSVAFVAWAALLLVLASLLFSGRDL